MDGTWILLAAAIGMSVAAATGVLAAQWLPDRRRARLDAIASPAGAEPVGASRWQAESIGSGIRSRLANVARALARLSRPGDVDDPSPLRVRFMNAGLREEHATPLFFGAKTLLALALPATMFVALLMSGKGLSSVQTLALLLAAATIGYYLPAGWLSRRIAARQQEIFESFPDAADLMLVCVEAGLGLDAALARVAQEMRLRSAACADELQRVILELRAGAARGEALRRLALRTGVDEVAVFTSMLSQADRFGTSIGDSLRVFAEEMRLRRRQRAEELAAKIPLKLLFPLVFCILPALFLVLLGPAFIQVYRVLLPAMSGNS